MALAKDEIDLALELLIVPGVADGLIWADPCAVAFPF
jgi:hypothetical protein